MKTIDSYKDTLYRLWNRSRHVAGRASAASPTSRQWEEEIKLVEHHGRGMEETMRYLYMQQPDFDTFSTWIQEAPEEETQDERLTEDVLTSEDLAFWHENGYVIVRNAITPAQCEASRQAIWEHLRATPTDPGTWYQAHEDMRGLMVMFYHHPALRANRASARVRRAYEQVYGTTNIHRNMDKVSFNPPETNDSKFKGSPLHWDVSLKIPIPFKLQGMLYLTDTDDNSGAFHCVPGFHNKIGEWLDSLPKGANPREEALKQLQPVPVPGKAGDFIIWHQALPHCATPNRGTTPRLVQYFSYLVPGVADADVWI